MHAGVVEVDVRQGREDGTIEEGVNLGIRDALLAGVMGHAAQALDRVDEQILVAEEGEGVNGRRREGGVAKPFACR